jgi:RNA polymerase sigma factor (sigma-70 family)
MPTITTTALLDRLHDPADEEGWREIDARYRPVIIGLARRVGLADADAADVAQEAMARFARSYREGKYERGRGRLSSWMLGIAHNCIVEAQRSGARKRERPGLTVAADQSVPAELTRLWEDERDREVLNRAFRALADQTKIARRTLDAFDLLVVHQMPPTGVAERLQMTVNDVYLAKHRCLNHLRAIVSDLTNAYVNDA